MQDKLRIATLASLAVAISAAACGKSDSPDAPVRTGEKYSLQLTAKTVADLPACTTALDGTSAYVATPPSVYTCTKSKWTEIKCDDSSAGSVAYASDTNLLLACVHGEWVQVPLPPGPRGPAGDAGPPGPPGADSLIATSTEPPGVNCAAGGIRVDVGVDTNGDGVLSPSEIQHTGYVCEPTGGPCTAGALRCNGQQPQQCGATGDWSNIGPSCGALDQACVSGACVGVCVPATSECVGASVRTCVPNGEWSSLAACTTTVANATATCTGGACSGFACNAGFSQCGAASCFDLNDDPSNCGSCGHSCGAASCVDGACASMTLASGLNLGGIASDGANVYYAVTSLSGTAGTIDGVIRSVPIGGGPSATLASGLDTPISITVDGGHVYWANRTGAGGFTGSVQSVPSSGGTVTTLATGLNFPQGVSVSHSFVFTGTGVIPFDQIIFANTDPAVNRLIEGVAPSGGTATTLYSTSTGHPDHTACDVLYVYFTDSRLGTVNKMASFGGAATVLATGQNDPSVIAVDSANVYWIDDNTPLFGSPGVGAVMKVPTSGGAPVTLATVTSGEIGPTGMAIDGTNVYYATYHSTGTGLVGTLWEVPIAGGTPIPLARGGASGAVATDATANVYWASGGSVLKSIK